jgi:hypothetical protein
MTLRPLRHIRTWLISVALIRSAAGVSPSEWRHFSPILTSQTRSLGSGEADRLLVQFCETPVRMVKGVDLTCTTRRLGPAFSDIVDRTFHPKGVLFGHFLGPEDDDAAVSGSSAEGHPQRFGGTLLLSRRRGVWTPIWYRSAVIIDSGEKVALPDRREILLCEYEDGGMGHALHYLYSVDFEHPSDLTDSVLAMADTFQDFCATQTQLLRGFHWSADRQEFFMELATTAWHRVSTDPGCANYPKRRPASVRLMFAVTPEGLRKVEAKSVRGPQ